MREREESYLKLIMKRYEEENKCSFGSIKEFVHWLHKKVGSVEEVSYHLGMSHMFICQTFGPFKRQNFKRGR